MRDRERIFINNRKHDGRPEKISFTRRDRTDFGSTQITNQRVSVKAVECSASPYNNDFMSCLLQDELGTKRDIKNIVFINNNTKNPKFTTYKQNDSGEIVTKMDFPSPAVCEILGHNSIGLTMNCYDSTRDKGMGKFEEDTNMNRNRGGNWQ